MTSHINSGLLLEEILEQVYKDFCDFIPYDRIGFALLEDEGRILQAKWAKTEYPVTKLVVGYKGFMQGSSLAGIIASGQPRIINDLPAYLEEKPTSEINPPDCERRCPVLINLSINCQWGSGWFYFLFQ